MPAYVSRDVALRLEHIERLAWSDLLAAADEAEQATIGLRATEIAGAYVMAADGSESLLQNRVLGFGLHEPVTDAAIGALLAYYREGPSFAINLNPFAEPAAASEMLAKRDFATFFHHLKWVRDDAPVAPVETSLEIVELGPERAHEWGALYSAIHDLSPAYAAWSARAVGRAGWFHHAALDQGRPVAASAMFVHEDLAWLGKTGTLASHRRMGGQGALLAARVRAGLAKGVRMFTLETAPDWPDLPGGSLRNAARAGFRKAYERPSWVHGLR